MESTAEPVKLKSAAMTDLTLVEDTGPLTGSYLFQITWARLADDARPYTVLTIGETNYISNERFSIDKPIRHDVSFVIIAGM